MSIRIRVTLVFAVALALILALGSWLFVSQLSAVMLRSVDSGLVAQLALARRSAGPCGRTNQESPPSDYEIQLIDATGRVRDASAEVGCSPLISAAIRHQAAAAPVRFTGTSDGENTRFAAGPYAGHPGWVAVAGISLESYDSTLSSITTGLTVGGIAVLVLAGLGAYLLTGAALAPVERLRRQAAALSSQDAGAGLAVPGTRDEVAALAATMNDLLGRMRGALQRQRDFVADASHELRTPLAVLTGELELAARPGRSRDELAAAVVNAAEETARLNRITSGLLLLARSDENLLALDTEVVSVGDIVAQSARMAQATAARTGIACVVIAPDRLMAAINPDRVRQAVDNLLDNALRFAPASSQVTIEARADGPDRSDLVISVADAGPGFPAEFLPHAFERFSRPHGGRARADGGAGLGLAIVSAIAAAHGGYASAANGQDGGAVVTLRLPGAVRPG